MKAAIWYVTANQSDYLVLSVLTHEKYDWVDQIVIVHTDEKEPKIIHNNDFDKNKVVHLWYPFGTGFDKSVENGGFDEIEARNFAIITAMDVAQPGSWLVQCDSDEFYSYDTKDQIEMASLNGHLGIRLNCNHFINPETVKYPLADPYDYHLRIWKADQPVFYRQNTNSRFMAKFPNKTTHCVPIGCDNYKQVTGLFHIHVKSMILNNREKIVSSDYGRKKIDYNVFNELYLNRWNLEN